MKTKKSKSKKTSNQKFARRRARESDRFKKLKLPTLSADSLYKIFDDKTQSYVADSEIGNFKLHKTKGDVYNSYNVHLFFRVLKKDGAFRLIKVS